MFRLFKSWRLLTVAVLASLAVLAGTTSAFAAEPGETNNWTNESVGGGPLQSQDTLSEARGGQTGALVQIWRGQTDNHVWLSVNNGNPFWVGTQTVANNTQTFVAPRVAYSNGWFYAFHTGIDGNIYWSRVFDTTIGANTPAAALGINWSPWTAITGNTTNQSVSIASDSSGFLMTYRGSGSNTALFSAWLQAGSDVFNPAQTISNIHSNSAPVVSYSPMFNTFTVVFRGLLDNQVYRTTQVAGQSTWTTPIALTGVTTPTSPVVIDDSDGNQLVAAVDFNGHINFEAINDVGETRGWSEETVAAETIHPVFLSLVGGIIYVLATLSNGFVQFKPAWNPSKGI